MPGLKRALLVVAGAASVVALLRGPEFSFGRIANAQSTGTDFQEVLVAGGLSTPTAMEYAPDGRLFVAEKSGGLRVIESGQLLSTPFFTAKVRTDGEQGLLGIAFDPAFAVNQFLYIYSTTSSSPSTTGSAG